MPRSVAWLVLLLGGILTVQLFSQTDRETAARLFQQKKFAEAAQALERHLKRHNNDDSGRLLLGLSYQLAGDTRAAEAEFLQVSSRRPRDARARLYLARARYLNGKLQEAKQNAEEARRLGEPAERVHNLVGLILEEQHDYEAALKAYGAATQSLDSFAEAHLNAGKLLLKMNRADEAVRSLRRAVALNGTAETFYHLGRAELAAGEKQSAERSLAKAASLSGGGSAKRFLEQLRAGGIRQAKSEPKSARDDVVPIRFREAAQAAGIDFVLQNHPTPEKYLVETMTGGVAAFDFNNDGRTDIYFVNGASLPSLEKSSPKFFNRLYRNDGDLQFTDVTEQSGTAGAGYSMGAAAGDYDNDGNVDLFVAGVNRNILFRNRGDGTFEDVTSRAGFKSDRWSVAGAWLDYDNDGLLDLFVVNYLKWSPSLDIFCGDRTKNLRVYCHPRHFEGLSNVLYRNRGDGIFEDVSQKSGIEAHVGKGMSVAAADYDGDGFVDIFVTNDTRPNFLFRNRGDGTFQEVGLEAGVAFTDDGKAVSSMGVDFRDYDNDGLPDISVTALEGETFPLFQNQGNGFFRDATFPSLLGRSSVKRSGWANALVDFNNDGWKDLFSANSHVTDNIEAFSEHRYRQPNSAFVNLRNGTFRDVSAEAGEDFQRAGAHRGAAFADFNGDGRIDIVVSRLGEPAELWKNETPTGHHWIILKLEGTRSCRDGIGTRVSIGDQHNHMTTSAGYASSSHFGVHFGIPHATIPKIEIRWPSGVVQVIESVKADRILRVHEPAR
jgi:tetratricopeptide (TPR) repeat protein